jgi:quinol monooxygenase YgiN
VADSIRSIGAGQNANNDARETVRMTVEWFVPLGQARSIGSALNSLMAETRKSRGCVRCSVSTGLADHGTVLYTEEWRSEADLRRHFESHAFTSLATLIDDAIDPPRVEFMLPGGTRSLDFVEEVRRRKR